MIIVTGASSGIGRALCFELARQRPKLVLAARNHERLEEVAQQCKASGAETLVVPTDVTSVDQCRRLIDQTVDEFGRIDVLINNAGAAIWSRFDEIADITRVDDLMRLNYAGSAYCTHFALPHLKQSRGRIVAMSSVSGLTGVPLLSAYASTKHAMVGLFESLRIELKDTGVSVTIIAPDFTRSEIFHRATKGSGELLGASPLRDDKLLANDVLARRVVRAIERRQRLLIASPRGKLLRWARLVAPRVVDFFTERAVRGK